LSLPYIFFGLGSFETFIGIGVYHILSIVVFNIHIFSVSKISFSFWSILTLSSSEAYDKEAKTIVKL